VTGTISFTRTPDIQEQASMTTSQTPSTGSTFAEALTRNAIAYFQQRQRNRVFQEVLRHFAKCVDEKQISKKAIAEKLGKDPSQITRWFADAEMYFTVVPFAERRASNYFHPQMGSPSTNLKLTYSAASSQSAARTATASASTAPLQVTFD
jgi:hypothetical protein